LSCPRMSSPSPAPNEPRAARLVPTLKRPCPAPARGVLHLTVPPCVSRARRAKAI
jgi:hypothetical protein